MTGPEHFREAEMLANEGCDYGCPHTGCEHHMAYLLLALVHSNLAVAASQALRGHEGLPERDRKAWYEAAATKTAPAVKPVQDAAA